MILNSKNLLILLINSLLFKSSYQKSPLRSHSEILTQNQINPNISATPQSVFTSLKKITHQGVVTLPERILKIMERISDGYQLLDEEIRLLKLCRITAARQNGKIKDLKDNTFLGFLRFDTNKVSFRGCGTVLGMKADALPFSKALANTIIEIDHVGGENATFAPFPKLELLTVNQLTKDELRFFNFDPSNSTHHQSTNQINQNSTQNLTQNDNSNHTGSTGTETSLPTDYKVQRSHYLIPTN